MGAGLATAITGGRNTQPDTDGVALRVLVVEMVGVAVLVLVVEIDDDSEIDREMDAVSETVGVADGDADAAHATSAPNVNDALGWLATLLFADRPKLYEPLLTSDGARIVALNVATPPADNDVVQYGEFVNVVASVNVN